MESRPMPERLDGDEQKPEPQGEGDEAARLGRETEREQASTVAQPKANHPAKRATRLCQNEAASSGIGTRRWPANSRLRGSSRSRERRSASRQPSAAMR